MSAAENLDHSPMTKGKYGPKSGKALTPNDVAEKDPAYLAWAFESWSDKPCSQLLYRECVRDVAENKQSIRVAQDQDEE